MPWTLRATLLAAAFATAGAANAAAPPAVSESDAKCSALSDLRLENVKISSAALLPAGAVVPGAFLPDYTGLGKGPPVDGLQAFCRVLGSIHPEAGSDIRFEVWLPQDGWNGRFSGIGIGGFAGSISYLDLSLALRAGQATAATDTGHQAGGMTGGLESAWAKGNPARIRDYGWRGIHLMTVNAKEVIAAYYGKPADRSYFMSCSGGGRQGLIEASRYPEDYDGIVAGAPAAQFTQLAMSMLWTVQAQLPEGAALKPDQAQLIGDEVAAQCDLLDGEADKSIDDPRQCKLDVSKLGCGASASAQCLSPAQLTALEKIADGPRDKRGRQVAFPYSLTASVKGVPTWTAGWEGWIMAGGQYPAFNSVYPAGVLRDFVAEPFADSASFDWDRDPQRLVAATGADLDAQPTMKKFFKRGGKLIIWHGWADPAIPAELAISFYEGILKKSGRRAKHSVRLFMAPEVQHCFGGNGASSFGHNGAPAQTEEPDRNIAMAVQQWVEKGRAPETLIGRMAANPVAPFSQGDKQRLLCGFPKRAVLSPGADPDKAASYACKEAPIGR